MIQLKTKDEISKMQQGGKMLAEIRDSLQAYAQPGIRLQQIEDKAQVLIAKTGGEPGFARVSGYSWATCLNVNDGFVHGIPNNYVLKDGDVLTIDIGLYIYGFNTDTAVSFIVGKIKDQKQAARISQFLKTGAETLSQALKVAKPGNYVGHISQTIQNSVEKAGYSVAQTLTGHGVGKTLHEPPKIPGFLRGNIENSALLQPGMSLAIEVLYLAGQPDIMTDPDGWTIRAKDGKITSVFEKTIALQDDGCIVLT